MGTEVLAFAGWEELEEPTLVGTLRSSVARQKERLGFATTQTGYSLPCSANQLCSTSLFQRTA